MNFKNNGVRRRATKNFFRTLYWANGELNPDLALKNLNNYNERSALRHREKQITNVLERAIGTVPSMTVPNKRWSIKGILNNVKR